MRSVDVSIVTKNIKEISAVFISGSHFRYNPTITKYMARIEKWIRLAFNKLSSFIILSPIEDTIPKPPYKIISIILAFKRESCPFKNSGTPKVISPIAREINISMILPIPTPIKNDANKFFKYFIISS